MLRDKSTVFSLRTIDCTWNTARPQAQLLLKHKILELKYFELFPFCTLSEGQEVTCCVGTGSLWSLRKNVWRSFLNGEFLNLWYLEHKLLYVCLCPYLGTGAYIYIWYYHLFKGTVSRDGYFFWRSKHFLIYTFWVFADGFQGLSKVFHCPKQ